MARSWGPWTLIKLEALEAYFSAFTNASQKAKGTLYLDLFGGRPENQERGTERMFPGSAVRAAMADPPFTKLIVSELNEQAAIEQRAKLGSIAGDRALVVPGDCNTVIPHAMANLSDGFRYAPTFALLDQYSAEIQWRTLQYLAAYKAAGRTKVELCIFFGDSFMVRGIHGSGGTANRAYAARIDRMFGNRKWRQIQAARDDDVIGGGELQHELVNLMRWQLEHQLGYATTLPLQMRNTRGNGIFTMIFATDHDVGNKVMRHLFAGAEDALDLMVANAKIQKKVDREQEMGQDALFGPDPVTELPERARPPGLPPLPPFTYEREWTDDEI